MNTTNKNEKWEKKMFIKKEEKKTICVFSHYTQKSISFHRRERETES